ncbi:DUF2934 domain-containing protein [bacterium]|nr:DUF2934 domain-containing protein [bacterium]
MNNDKIESKIAEKAYFYFIERGYKHGYDVEDWARAEKEIMLEIESHKKKKTASRTTGKRTTSSSKRSSNTKSTKSKSTAKGRTRAKSK